MSRRLRLYLLLMVLHGLAIWYSPAWLTPFIAGSIYLPLMLFKFLSLPVFGQAVSGGWAAPSLSGWIILILFWSLIWFRAACLIETGIKKWKTENQ